MKLSTSNTFDISQVADTKSFADLQTFFEYSNAFTSEVVEGFNKGITLRDNLDYVELSLTMVHGGPTNIGLRNPKVVYIGGENLPKGFSLSTNADSTKNLTVFFRQSQYIRAKSALWQAGTIVKYQVQNTANYSLGDFVIISGFGTLNNNGTFQIIEINPATNDIYVINRLRTSVTGDEVRTGYVGESLTPYKITLGLFNA